MNTQMEHTEKKALRLLELYSGIGGMRFAMEFTGIPFEVVAAVDINPVVNRIYEKNFGNLNHFQRNIQSYTAKELNQMNLDIITMSPPCQPFTRVGLKKDVEDARTDSFVYILKVISELQNKPVYFLLENVKGFEDSQAHSILIETLKNCGYTFQELLLSPNYFGVPNSRLRYYVIAKLRPSGMSFPVVPEILSEMPKSMGDWKSVCKKCHPNEKCHIKHFLEDHSEEDFDSFLVPDSILLKYAKVFDIVHEDSCHSCCFTKAYGRYSLGTGSVFTPCSPLEVSTIFQEISTLTNKTEELQLLQKLRLRYFTSREVANLMGFPSAFTFPQSINEKQRYKTLGNSINVFVVSCLLKLLFEDE